MITIKKKQEQEIRNVLTKFEIRPEFVSKYRLAEMLQSIITEHDLKGRLNNKHIPLKKVPNTVKQIKYECTNEDCNSNGKHLLRSTTNCKVHKAQQTMRRCIEKELSKL